MARGLDTVWRRLADGVPPDWACAWGQDHFGLHVSFAVGDVTQRQRWIPPGTFMMGSPGDEPGRWDDEGPQHEVSIASGFWIFDTACTEALWQAVMGQAPNPARGGMFPVTGISWGEAQTFIARINALHAGLGLSLPSEACWEYACRAGSAAPYSFGAEITKELACYGANAPVPVGSLKPNPWGLHEMHGNVLEWCADTWHESYAGAPTDGLAWTDGGAAVRVLRGGSWVSVARDVRSAFRDHYDPTDRGDDFGFRCARVQA